MPKLLKLLDELESALPEMRDMLESNADYMAEDEEGGEEFEMPEMPEDMGPPADEEGADDLMMPPPLKGKKKPFPPE